MGRRQRAGRGGKDYHGCGNRGCPVCSPGRAMLGPTRQEQAAELEQREQCGDQGPAPESVERCPTCGTEGCA